MSIDNLPTVIVDPPLLHLFIVVRYKGETYERDFLCIQGYGNETHEQMLQRFTLTFEEAQGDGEAHVSGLTPHWLAKGHLAINLGRKSIHILTLLNPFGGKGSKRTTVEAILKEAFPDFTIIT